MSIFLFNKSVIEQVKLFYWLENGWPLQLYEKYFVWFSDFLKCRTLFFLTNAEGRPHRSRIESQLVNPINRNT